MNVAPSLHVAVIVPALNEEDTIAELIRRLPMPARCVTIVDNGSTDETAALAEAAGATVVHEPRRGYGRACLAGIAANPDADVLLFADADLSERPEDAEQVLAPILTGRADFVMGARRGRARPWHAAAGTALCVGLINRLWGGTFTDLGPFRAIRRSSLEALGMMDQTWGWTIEMQAKALEANLCWMEVPIESGPRAGGRSKISGSLTGTVRAATRMLTTIGQLYWRRSHRRWAATRAGRTAPCNESARHETSRQPRRSGRGLDDGRASLGGTRT
ncbi:MAG: glycosyltransferase family 2 protein [Vicinamibacterales bacterium]